MSPVRSFHAFVCRAHAGAALRSAIALLSSSFISVSTTSQLLRCQAALASHYRNEADGVAVARDHAARLLESAGSGDVTPGGAADSVCVPLGDVANAVDEALTLMDGASLALSAAIPPDALPSLDALQV